ncbi:MAG: hypothetical protein HKN76_22880 [Saprospiraceae bacterium]|nr:hypothetical protein [Saprospiraceae bacterium]
MAIRVLVLVDHAGHSKENSAYSLSKALFRHPEVDQVLVASRSTPENASFFFSCDSISIKAITVHSDFAFDPSGAQFNEMVGPFKSIHEFDLILLRLPHPIHLPFFNYLETQFDPSRIINRPSAIRITGSKDFLLHVSEVCPPMRLCRSLTDVISFHDKYDLVLKPLRSYGGVGLFKLQNGMLVSEKGETFPLTDGGHLFSHQFENGGILAMKYLSNVNQGDKRIVVVNGKVAAASLRLPAPGSWLCNVSQGGISQGSDITPRESYIANFVHAKIGAMGIGIFGMDTLVDDDGERVLSEINTLSVGGIGPMDIQHQRSVSDMVAAETIHYFKQNAK